MKKFKIGDRVKVLFHEAEELIGLAGKVIGLEEDQYHVSLGSSIPGGESIEVVCDGSRLSDA